MPLASKDGKLYVKTELDEDGNEVQKLCTSCCGDDDPYGCCCYLDSEGNWQKEQLRASDCAQMPDSSHSPDTDCDDVECSPYCCVYQYGMGGSIQADTAEEAIQAAYQNAIWTVNTFYPGQADPTWGYRKSDGTWTQEAGFNSTTGQYFQNPVWIWNTSSILYKAPECLDSYEQRCTAPFAFPKDGDCSTDCPDITPEPEQTGACCYFYRASSDDGGVVEEWRCADGITEQECLMTGSYDQTFYPGKTCEEIECPSQPEPVPGICIYREDGLGTCWGYGIEGEELPTQLFATEEEAQAYIDAGGCPDNDPSAPACAKCWCYPYEPDGAPPETPWAIIQECVVYTEEYDEFGNETGNYICEKTIYLSNCTEEECQAQAEANPLADIEWRNDMPATDCRPVGSEEECTESTGTFCPDLTECPDDPSAGCPDPNRSNPLP